jgi:hypothetical protein
MTTIDGSELMVKTNSDGTDSTHETGTATGLEMTDGSLTTDGVLNHDERATVTTYEAGTVLMKAVGTDVGTLVHSMTTTDGDEATVMTWFDGKDWAQAAGT